MDHRKISQLGRFFFGARSRILIWLVLLISISTSLSIFTIRHILRSQLLTRLQNSLNQEVEEIEKLASGRNPLNGKPFGEDVKAIFDVFLARNIPEDDEYLITLFNGEIYQTNPVILPTPLMKDPNFWRSLATVSQRQKNFQTIDNKTIIYLAYPLKVSEQSQGVFVVAQSLTNHQKDIDRAVLVVTQVMVIMMVLALILSWIAIGKILSPLQTLTDTARSIKDFDQSLNRRIPVKGKDEIAELSITFNKMLDRLQASFATQREFINDASHEFQTPITVIGGNLEILNQSLGENHQHHEIIELMQDELNRMSRLVNDLLFLARAERPDFLTLDFVEIEQLTHEIFNKAKSLAPRKWHLAHVGCVHIVADRQRLTQAVMNLVQNAVEHTQMNHVIEIGSKLVDNMVCFWVKDTGIGISSEDQTRILQRFARATGCRRQSQGAGLGLSIVNAIALAHGGNLTITSQLGKGSLFTITLPLDPPQDTVNP